MHRSESKRGASRQIDGDGTVKLSLLPIDPRKDIESARTTQKLGSVATEIFSDNKVFPHGALNGNAKSGRGRHACRSGAHR